MNIEHPTFNPRDEKYKNVADLPKKEQANFADVEGGFVTKDTSEYDKLIEGSMYPGDTKTKLGKIVNTLVGIKQLSVSDKIIDRERIEFDENQKANDYIQNQRVQEKKAALNLELTNKYEKVVDAAKTGDAEILHDRLLCEKRQITLEELETFAKNYIEKNKK